MSAECLISVAFIRDGTLHKGFRSHSELRASLGDKDPYTGNRTDDNGFWTSAERFVSRAEAVEIGVRSGQLDPTWLTVSRELLSSDVHRSAGADMIEGERRVLAIDVASKDDFTVVYELKTGDSRTLHINDGFDCIGGSTMSRSDHRCRSPEKAAADRAKLNTGEPESRQVRRARERALLKGPSR